MKMSCFNLHRWTAASAFIIVMSCIRPTLPHLRLLLVIVRFVYLLSRCDRKVCEACARTYTYTTKICVKTGQDNLLERVVEGGQSHECPSAEVLVFDADLAQKLVVLRRKTLKIHTK